MADAYIDPHETQIYGPFAREQMAEIVLRLIPALDSAVRHAIDAQQAADEAMAAVLSRGPAPLFKGTDPLPGARDALVRFGKYIESIKGHPVPLSEFFGRDAPSLVARRRAVKLVSAMRQVVAKIEEHKSVLPGWKSWQSEISEVLAEVDAHERASRAQRAGDADVRPEVAAERAAWLEVYGANKRLIEGVLAHAKKPQLLAHVFDDLAEVHRTKGTSDTDTSGGGSTPAVTDGPTTT